MIFLEKSHTYLNDDGIIIPSVTQLISWKFGSGYEDVPKEVLQAKASYGTRIHALVEEYCKKGIAQWKTPLEAWQDAYEHEKFITAKINNITKISREENDYTSEPILSWFLNEQIEEEKNTEKVARELAMVENSKEGILLLDRELAARVFPAGSPLDPAAYNAVA